MNITRANCSPSQPAGFSSSAVIAAIARVKPGLFPLPDDVAGGCPTRGSVCILQTLQAGGSQLAQTSLLVSSLKLATESVGVPGGNGQSFDRAAKPWAFLPGEVPGRGVTALFWLPQFRLSQELLCQVEIRCYQARTPLLSLLAMAEANSVALLALLAELWRWRVAGGLGKGLQWFSCLQNMWPTFRTSPLRLQPGLNTHVSV